MGTHDKSMFSTPGKVYLRTGFYGSNDGRWPLVAGHGDLNSLLANLDAYQCSWVPLLTNPARFRLIELN